MNERKDIDNIFFREKEVWWIALGVNVGFEQDGKGEEFRRPVLILKKFNKYLVLAVPITTKVKKDNKYYISCSVAGDAIPRMAIISQVRPIDTKRFIDKLGVADDDSYIKIKKRNQSYALIAFLKLSDPLRDRARRPFILIVYIKRDSCQAHLIMSTALIFLDTEKT